MKLPIYPSTQKSYSEGQLQAVTRHLNLPDVSLPFWGQRRKVPAYRIVRLEGEGNYTILHFSDGSRLIVSLTLKKLEARLPTQIFARPHKKNIVNLLYVREIRPKKSMSLILANGDEIEVSRRKATKIVRLVNAFQQELVALAEYSALTYENSYITQVGRI